MQLTTIYFNAQVRSIGVNLLRHRILIKIKINWRGGSKQEILRNNCNWNRQATTPSLLKGSHPSMDQINCSTRQHNEKKTNKYNPPLTAWEGMMMRGQRGK